MLAEFRNMLQVSLAVGRGDTDRVAALCNDALARNAKDTFALGVLADMYWRNEKVEQALPFALRILDITPNDFDALRIAVEANFTHGDKALTYRYAKCLCAAAPSVSPSSSALTAFLRPFVWIPKIRAASVSLADGMEETKSHREEWAEWARAYVLWHESESLTAEPVPNQDHP